MPEQPDPQTADEKAAAKAAATAERAAAKAEAKAAADAAAELAAAGNIPVSLFIRDASHGIEVAGLLASDPDLQTAEMTSEEWDAALADYLASPRP